MNGPPPISNKFGAFSGGPGGLGGMKRFAAAAQQPGLFSSMPNKSAPFAFHVPAALMQENPGVVGRVFTAAKAAGRQVVQPKTETMMAKPQAGKMVPFASFRAKDVFAPQAPRLAKMNPVRRAQPATCYG